jgi:AcrR family transcriptional regulator
MTQQVRTRPKNRRESIIVAASAHFHQRGYAGTSLEDIAGDLGITAPAIYRHFHGKDAVYTAALEANLRQLEACVAAAVDTPAVLHGLAVLAVEYPTLGLLWRPDRRRRLVDPDGAIEQRLSSTVQALGTLLEREATPGIAPLLARAALAVVSSTGFYESALAPADQARQLEAVLAAVAEFRPSGSLVELSPVTDTIVDRPWASRRSAVLDACSALVIQRGSYHAVTIEEIAATASVSPATVYQLFSTKAELFAAVLRRAVNWATVAIQRASSSAASAEEALELVVASSLELSAQHPSWAGSLADELASLPTDEQREVVIGVDEYLAEWLVVCEAVTAPASTEEVRVRMRAALGVIDDRAVVGSEELVLSVEDMCRLVRQMLLRSE